MVPGDDGDPRSAGTPSPFWPRGAHQPSCQLLPANPPLAGCLDSIVRSLHPTAKPSAQRFGPSQRGQIRGTSCIVLRRTRKSVRPFLGPGRHVWSLWIAGLWLAIRCQTLRWASGVDIRRHDVIVTWKPSPGPCMRWLSTPCLRHLGLCLHSADHVSKEFRRGKWMGILVPAFRRSGGAGRPIPRCHLRSVYGPTGVRCNPGNFCRRGLTRGRRWVADTLPSPVRRSEDSYLVDPASSHMLVSKIKPCMSKYKQNIQ